MGYLSLVVKCVSWIWLKGLKTIGSKSYQQTVFTDSSYFIIIIGGGDGGGGVYVCVHAVFFLL